MLRTTKRRLLEAINESGGTVGGPALLKEIGGEPKNLRAAAEELQSEGGIELKTLPQATGDTEFVALPGRQARAVLNRLIQPTSVALEILEAIDGGTGNDRVMIADLLKRLPGLDDRVIRSGLRYLEGKGAVKLSTSDQGHLFRVFLLPLGQVLLHDGLSPVPPPATQIGDRYEFHGVSNSLIAVKSTLQEVNQRLTSSSLPDPTKEKAQELLASLLDATAQLPDEHKENGERIADYAAHLVKESARKEPDKRMMEVTAEGLKEAAMAIISITPAIITIVHQLIPLLLH